MVAGCVGEVRYASLSNIMLLLPNGMHTFPTFTGHNDATRWPLIVSESPWAIDYGGLSSDRCSAHYFPEVQVRWADIMKGSEL